MGILSRATALSGWTALSATLGYTAWTRRSKIEALSPHDYLFGTTLFARYNPNNAPTTSDLCLRRVPLDQIQPELLEDANRGGTKLVESFCAGLWSGWGYACQRSYLSRNCKGASTATHLWSIEELKTSGYAPGTQITDRFEVISKTRRSIILRRGDSPRNSGFREHDGLLEMSADVNKEEGCVEFGMKSIFYNALEEAPIDGNTAAGPLGPWAQWLHQQYEKVLMETAIKACVR